MSCHLISNLVTHNPLVVGSSPTGPTKLKAAHCAAFVFLGFEKLKPEHCKKVVPSKICPISFLDSWTHSQFFVRFGSSSGLVKPDPGFILECLPTGRGGRCPERRRDLRRLPPALCSRHRGHGARRRARHPTAYLGRSPAAAAHRR